MQKMFSLILSLAHIAKKRKYHCEEHGAYHYFVALRKFVDRNFDDDTGNSLKIGLGIALEQLEIVSDNGPAHQRSYPRRNSKY